MPYIDPRMEVFLYENGAILDVVGTSELTRAMRRKRILNLLAQNKTQAEISKIEGIAYETVWSDIQILKKEMVDAYNKSITQSSVEQLILANENTSDVIGKAYQLYENTLDERTKILCLKTILEGADLKKRIVMEGITHIKVKEVTESLEKAKKLAEKSTESTGGMIGDDKLKSLMPAIQVKENPKNLGILVDAGSTEPVPIQEESATDSPEIANTETESKTEKLFNDINLNRHVKTNLFLRMEEDDQKEEDKMIETPNK